MSFLKMRCTRESPWVTIAFSFAGDALFEGTWGAKSSYSQEMHCWPPGEKKKADDLTWCRLLSHSGSRDTTSEGWVADSWGVQWWWGWACVVRWSSCELILSISTNHSLSMTDSTRKVWTSWCRAPSSDENGKVEERRSAESCGWEGATSLIKRTGADVWASYRVVQRFVLASNTWTAIET